MTTPRCQSSSLKYSQRLRAAGAVAVAAGAIGSASAAVTVVEVNQQLGPIGGTTFLSFDALADDYVAGYVETYDANVRFCGVGLLNFDTANFAWHGTSLAEGDVVDGTLSYEPGNVWDSLPGAGETRFYGYRMANQGAGNDETYYGYVKITGIDPDFQDGSFTFDFYSFETEAGAGITLIPEPGTAALGLMGLIGATFRRRRKDGN